MIFDKCGWLRNLGKNKGNPKNLKSIANIYKTLLKKILFLNPMNLIMAQ